MIMSGHATFVLVKRAYHILSYSILKIKSRIWEETVQSRPLPSKELQLQLCCGRTLFWLLSSPSNSKNCVLYNHTYNECFRRHPQHNCSLVQLIILTAIPHACRSNITRFKLSGCLCVCWTNVGYLVLFDCVSRRLQEKGNCLKHSIISINTENNAVCTYLLPIYHTYKGN